MERPCSSPETHQIYICVWNNSYRTLAADCCLPKSKPISLEWGRAKNKDKKESKDFGTGTCTPGTQLWRRKSLHTLGTLSWARGREELPGIRGEHSSKCLGGKMEILHRDRCGNSTSQSPTEVSRGRVLKVQASGWDPGERTRVDCLKHTPGANATQLRESREKPLPPRGKRSLSRGPSDSMSLQITVAHALLNALKWNK